ncbi:MAG: glutamate dehydrogenase [Hyphomicrobiales bacterium]|jgi:glutamate dehydrogenase|nr:glutamate dehydrogenase [Hyphomicrobiales bacterium]
MNVQPQFGSDDERAARRLIEQAGTILKGLRGDMPESFAPLMFAGVSPEDLVRYEARELADLAEAAWLFLAERKPGAPKVRFESRPGPTGAERIKAVSIIEMINNDTPFLLDSVMAELTQQGIDVRLVLHPIFTVERDHTGALIGFRGDGSAVGSAQRESFIHIHIERIEDAARQAEIVQAIEAVLADVRVCVQDWRPMMARVGEVIAEIKNNPPPLPVEEIAEATQFLEWLVANNFTFLGLRDYALTADGQDNEPIFETGLGILRDPQVRVLRRGNELVSITPEIMEFLQEPKQLIITKANVRSRVHRRVHMDYIGVKRFDDDGQLIGEVRIVGLFTSTAYTRSTRSIPYLRRKVDNLMRRSGFDPDSHSGKAFAAVLESYSRDELFQIDEDTLYQFVLAIMHLDERPRVRVLARRDRFDRFVSVMVFVPRERYDSAAREKIGSYLASAYKGRVSAFYPFFTEGPLVRVHFIIARYQGETPDPERATLEQAVEALVRTWTDGLAEALTLVHEPIKAQQLIRRYRDAFPVAYREAYVPPVAVADIRLIESLSPIRPLGADFYSRREGDNAGAGLKVWSREKPIPLSERVPVLENMGFKVVDERTYRIEPSDMGAVEVWLHDMLLERADGQAFDIEALKARLEATFMAVMRGRAENDGYNALALTAGLQWRDVALVRTMSRYMRQVRVPYSQDYMWATLRRHPGVAAQVVALFHSRFDPRVDISMEARAESQTAQLAEIETALAAVESLDEDRILRHFVNAVTSALRTNFYQTENGQPKPTIAIKFDSRKVEGLPLPKPLYEIFVYSPRVEGVHLRFGKVARGGIRWSDRPQDFRTEVLGLVKAQQVKNAVIVPVGAKGGFVPKQLPLSPREAVQAEGTAAYTVFISSLLDITDNLGPDGVIPPDNVVRHDDDDPYLVVAADKGTATFSDTANRISLDHGFWLGDAFASGGSAGYDHKKMGITARGAWEAVRRHFREMDVDITVTPFTVAGVGDMSGDVFGNGMLRERTIKLVAAFDHRDIFIDPNPDPERSFAERQRLFDLSRSSWQDYNKDYLSAGGGIYSRKAKEIALSEEARTLLGLESAKVAPPQVMTAILKLNTDLLWFGGIGTYIRATAETDDQVGDRVNDPIRVTGAALRCKVIGEGANLGVTQKGRVEAAMRGVRLNTDAIDNSAGVNTSDVEVNIKIALTPAMRDGRLSLDARDKLLVEMTEEVGQLVLRNNYQQTLALSLSQRRGLEDLGFQQRLMQTLESRGHLDRAVEYLPDDMEIGERRKRGQGLTRPELAVLLAYAKLTLYGDLLESSVPDDPYLGRELQRYFPSQLVARFPDALEQHRLRREIISTQLTNSMINRGGPSFAVRIGDQTGAPAAAIAAAFFVVRNSYDMIALNSAIDGLDNKITGKLQLDLYAAVEDLLLDRIVWFVRNVDISKGLEAIVEHYRAGIEAVAAALGTVLLEDAKRALAARVTELTNAGVADELARRIANLRPLAAAPDIVSVADRTGRPVEDVAATYFAAGAFFQLDRIASAARGIQVTDYFDRLALDRALDSIGEAERRLTAEMVGDGVTGPQAVDAWVTPRAGEVERIRAAVHGIASSGLTLSKLSVAASLLGDLVKH